MEHAPQVTPVGTGTPTAAAHDDYEIKAPIDGLEIVGVANGRN